MWMAEREKVCPGCGTRGEEWRADPVAYVGWTERCPGCEVLAQEQDNLDPKNAKGVRVMLVRNDPSLDHGGR